MKTKTYQISAAIATVMALSGCGTVGAIRGDIEKDAIEKASIFDLLLKTNEQSRVEVRKGVYLPAKKVKATKEGEWLKEHQVQLDIRQPVSLRAVVEKLAEQGINISSNMPLDAYNYVGKINATDAKAALQIILWTMGLDYQTDDGRKIVIIKPMSSKTWYLDIGNRKSIYSGDMSGSSLNLHATGLANSRNGTIGTNTGTSQGNAGNNQATNIASVETEDDFWKSLDEELKSRLTVLMPQEKKGGSRAISLPTPINGGGNAMPPRLKAGTVMNTETGTTEQKQQTIGTYSLNAETGAITVQAPHWILQELETYFKRVRDMYNTDISFSGEIVLVTSEKNDSEGFDISGFTKWLTRNHTGVLAIANNALGGITMSVPGAGTSGPAIQGLGQAGVKGPVIGYSFTGEQNAMDIFNAYLSEIGKVSVVQRPVVTTTSGVPGIFSKKYTDYYNTVSQQAASNGMGSAVMATQNVLIPVEMGTELRINPRIDVSTGLIRAQLSLNQVIQSGVKVIPQVITYGDNSTTVNTTVPLLTKQNLSGEVLLHDGDLIVVGGQTEKSLSSKETGIPGEDGPMGGILGNKKGERGTQTYYFALRVSVNKRN